MAVLSNRKTSGRSEADSGSSPERPSPAEAVLVTSMMRAVSVFRWVALAWASVGVLIGRSALVRPAWAVLLLSMAAVLTLYLHRVGRSEPGRLVTWPLLSLELGLGLILLVGDGLVFSDERSQSLPWAWPAAGIAAVGIATAGRRDTWLRRYSAVLVAVVIGVVSLATESTLLGRFSGPGQLGIAFSKIGLWLLVGLIVGPLMARLLRAERLISVAKAREELARELHDGVLQTLAVVQRRSNDTELAALARDQEHSLRAYLSDARLVEAAAEPTAAGSPTEVAAAAASLSPGAAAGLDAALRRVAADAERLHPLTVQVVVATDCPVLSPSAVAALKGAVAEALTNAGKHGGADRVTVFAEPVDDTDQGNAGVFVSVHDNGAGFVVDGVAEGIGLSRSIKGRMVDAGGRVEISSRPGKGTEVQLWL